MARPPKYSPSQAIAIVPPTETFEIIMHSPEQATFETAINIPAIVQPAIVDVPAAEPGYIEAHGFSGGLWLLWGNSVNMTILHVSNRFINAIVNSPTENKEFQLIMVYASPSASKRKYVWHCLEQLNPSGEIPCITSGGFNTFISSDERLGRHKAYHIFALKIGHVGWCTDHAILRQVVVDFYSTLFSSELILGSYGVRVAQHGGRLDSDGARCLSNGYGTCGGVAMNDHNHWLFGYAKFMGICSPLEVELRSAYLVLMETLRHGYHQVAIEINSLEAIRFLRNDSLMDGCCFIMRYLLELLKRNWIVRLNHISRNLNKLIDGLAKLPITDSLVLTVFDTPPRSVLHILYAEAFT
ncbi:hypothetical protein V6N12_042065 [Hibiscus sabdariffa]|uniref:RNase H type-1 domain-containing protein n=1 Tax=Hibiscus sabdariffa TaxID=183260 RepID=A0ABR2EDP6_9ROSI